jgi:hypothetical protein
VLLAVWLDPGRSQQLASMRLSATKAINGWWLKRPGLRAL